MALLQAASRCSITGLARCAPCSSPASTARCPTQAALASGGSVLGAKRPGMTTVSHATAEKADPTQKQDWSTSDMPSCEGKVYVVTGSSDGLGYVCAKDIAAKGGHVIVASRNLQKCEKAAEDMKAAGVSGKVEPMHLDLASFKSVVDFAKTFKAKNLPLNVLVGNAGVFLVPHDHTEEGFEISIGVNYWGHFLLFHLLMDKLKESAPSRFIFMASLIEQLGKVPWHNLKQTDSTESGLFEYANSKIMGIMLSREMNKRLKGQGIECFTANPGIVNTPLNGPKLDHNKLTGNLMDISSSLAGQTTEEASICITRAATDPALEGYGGSYFSSPYLTMLPIHVDHAAFQEPINGLARDEEAWKRLYDESLKLVNETLQSKGMDTIQGI